MKFFDSFIKAITAARQCCLSTNMQRYYITEFGYDEGTRLYNEYIEAKGRTASKFPVAL